MFPHIALQRFLSRGGGGGREGRGGGEKRGREGMIESGRGIYLAVFRAAPISVVVVVVVVVVFRLLD